MRSFFGLDIHGEESKKAKDAVMKALALDDSLGEAYSALGEIQDNYDWNFTEGEQMHQRALELNPNSSRIHAQYGMHLMDVGRLDEAMVESKVAIELEPTSQFNNGLLGDALYWSRRYDEAITQYKRAMALNVSNPVYYDVISKLYAMKGDYEQAYENRESWIVTIVIDPELDPLRSDPRFDQLLHRIGLK